MHPRIVAQRTDIAQKRLARACAALANRWEIEPPAQVHSRYPEVKQLFELEGLATFVETLAQQDKGVDPLDVVSQILAINGLTKTSTEAIRAHYGLTE